MLSALQEAQNSMVHTTQVPLMGWKLVSQATQMLEELHWAQLLMLQLTQDPLVTRKPSLQLVQTEELTEQESGRQLASAHANTQLLLPRVDPGWQFEHTLAAVQSRQPVTLQGTQVLVAEAKLKPTTQAEHTLLLEQAEQLVFTQVTQDPLLAEKPVAQAKQLLFVLHCRQLVTLQVTHEELKGVKPV